MPSLRLIRPVAAALVLGVAAPAAAQIYEAVGTRAQGMGGAFVAVADDASAVYWNPGGLASGAFFGLTIDYNTADRGSAGTITRTSTPRRPASTSPRRMRRSARYGFTT